MSHNAGFTHILSTRLGIGVYDEAWFDYRLSLFENITIPSITGQTATDFTWLIVIDRNMPPLARKRLETAVGEIPQAKTLEVHLKKDFRPTVMRWSRERAAELEVDRILSTRIDDDDAIRLTLFERLHQEARTFLDTSEADYAAFAPTLGCMWLPSERRGYTRYHDSHSIALSVMEPAQEARTVYAWPHREIKPQLAPRGAYCKHIDGDTRWWLYTVTSISDSDKGDGARHKKIMEHKYGYEVDDDFLAVFGITPSHMEALASMPEPTPHEPTKFLTLRGIDIEEEIREVRKQVKSAGPFKRRLLNRRLAKLERQRKAIGASIVS